MRQIKVLSLILALAFIAGFDMGQAQAALPAIVKAKCVACHSFGVGVKHKVGPNLHGIVGKKAGTAVDYRYGSSLKGADFIWTLDRLRLWLADSRRAIKELTRDPDAQTKMPAQRLSGAKLDEVIAYLVSISPSNVRMAAPSRAIRVAPRVAVMTRASRATPRPMPVPADVSAAASSAPPAPKSVFAPAAPVSSPAVAGMHPAAAGPAAPESMPPASKNGHGEVAHKTIAAMSPAPSPETMDAMFAEVDRILARMRDANIVFNAPDTINLKERAKIQLALSLKQTVDELKRAINERGEKVSASIKVSTEMEARLTGSSFQITPIKAERQVISPSKQTGWLWEVKPTEAGIQSLHLTLDALFEIQGKTKKRTIRTFDKTIAVNVTPGQQIRDFVKNNWQWLWTVILVPLAGWGWRKYRG